MAHHSRKLCAAAISERAATTSWLAMTIAWLGISLKLAIETSIRTFLRPATTTILDVPAVPSQFPPIDSIRTELIALGEPANDSSVPPARHPQPTGEPTRLPANDRHPEPLS